MSNEKNQSLAQDIAGIKGWLGDFFGQLSGGKGDSDEYAKVAYFDNPNSIWDEVLKLSWFALAVATGFTAYYGYRYHYAIFKNGGGNEWEALAVSLVIFALGEILKVFLGHRFFRAIFSGAIKKGLAQLVLTICLGIIFWRAMVWSIEISANGYGLVNANAATQAAIQTQTDYSALTKDIDAQIAVINGNAKLGASVTWKGKITEDGQEIMKRNAKAVAPLLSQREAIIANAIQRDSMLLAQKSVSIGQTMHRQNDYGGKAEWSVCFFLFMIGLLEYVNYRNNKSQVKESVAEEKPNLFKRWFSLPQRPITAEKKEPLQEDKRPRPIGFKRYDDDSEIQNISNKKDDTCNYRNTSVITDESLKDGLSATEIVRLLKEQKRSLDTEINHYCNRNGDISSIKRRIGEKFNAMLVFMMKHERVVDPHVEKMNLFDWAENLVKPIIDGKSPEAMSRVRKEAKAK